MTSLAAVRPLMVRTPSEGGQSMSTVSYSAIRGSRARASTCSRPVRVIRCTSAPARSIVAGKADEVAALHQYVGCFGPAGEHVVQ